MRKILRYLTCLIAVTPVLSVAETITFYSPEIPGLISKNDNGKVVNKAAVEFVHIIASRSGITDNYQVVPFVQAFESAQNMKATCALGIGRDKSTEEKFKWVGPVVRQKILLYANKSDRRVIHNLEDARKMTIGVRKKTVVASMLREAGFLLDESDDELINLKKLTTHKIDLWAANAIPALAAVKELGVSEPRLITSLGVTDGYVACNPQVSDETIEKLNLVIRSMAKTGELSKSGL